MEQDIPVLVFLLLEEHHRRNFARIRRQILRDTENSFDISDALFIQYYRLTKPLVSNLIEQLEAHVNASTHGSAIPFYLKVLVTLSFLAAGSYQTVIGTAALTNLSQPSVSKAVSEVCHLIRLLMPNYIRFPRTLHEKINIEKGFYEKWGMTGLIGAIDGTHVEIVAPPMNNADEPPFVFINRKGKHSINVMLISDSECRILAVNSRFPGSVHDAAVWQMSGIRRHLQT